MNIDLKLPQSFFEEEPREIRVSSDKKRVWAVELDLLAKFDDVCRRNDIQYFIDGGTLLGAARHKGFIPWDDDVDVCMLRADFERLEMVASSEFKEPYFWQTFKTDIFSARGHGTLRNSNTTAIVKSNLINGRTTRRFNQGIFLDVFPLDNIPDGSVDSKRFLTGVQERIDRVGNIKSFNNDFAARGFRVVSSLRGIISCGKYISDLASSRFDVKRALKKASVEHEEWCKQYNNISTELCCTIAHWPNRKPQQYYKRRWFENVVMLDFEMLKVPAPCGWQELLSGLYGDWHKHVIGNLLHGQMFFDVEKSYLKYF